MSRITSVSIGELCNLASLRKKYNLPEVEKELYLIPDYQRGYRWDANIHVEALLNDLHDFMTNQKDKKEKYCLQPIVVTQSQSNPLGWEVIDGQQRLTTLFLLLKALKVENALGLKIFDLKYEAREKSNSFIQNLVEQNLEDHSEPDFHYMTEAWKRITKWLQQREKEDPTFKVDFNPALIKSVNVIWYDVESDNKETNIDIFNRLNIGKIPLTDAELVKALLLTKIKPLYSDDLLELTMRQSEINDYWHHIEHELRKPQKWGFLTGNIQKDYANHIDLIFDLMANNIKSAEPEKYTTFLWFENQIKEAAENDDDIEAEEDSDYDEIDKKDSRSIRQAKKAMELWDEIKKAYARINSWFADNSVDTKPTIYHYIGYLLASRRAEITDIYNASFKKSKKEFINYLYEKVRGVLFSEDNGEIKEIAIEDLEYGPNNAEIERVLLLFNVLTCQKIAKGVYNRFPFDRFNVIRKESKTNGWSLEHIFAQKSEEPINDRKKAFRWLEDTRKSIENIPDFSVEVSTDKGPAPKEVKVSDLLTEIDNMKALGEKDINLSDFNNLREKVRDAFGDIKMHNISNLALLSSKDNAALNNAIFPTKRDKIIELEKSGRYIPQCTLNVFLKFYSTADSQPYYWSELDAKEYLNQILSTLKAFKENHGNQYTR